MSKAWDHKRCEKHLSHPAFAKKLCVTTQGEAEALTFADEMVAAGLPASIPKRSNRPIPAGPPLPYGWGGPSVASPEPDG